MFKYGYLKNLLVFIFIISICFQNVNSQASNGTAKPTPLLCNWQKIRVGINAEEINAQNRKSVGYAINPDHCGSLCMMNQAMFKTCGAYAFTYELPFTGPKHNCFMYPSEIDSASFKSTGPFDLYKQSCNSSSSSATPKV